MVGERVIVKKTTPQLIYQKIVLLTVISFSLSACSGYGSSFSCRDASGLNCMPLSLVDQRINSGRIAEVELKERAKCKSRNCSAKSLIEKPDIKPSEFYKVKLQQEAEQRVLKNGNSLYIK